MKPIPLPDQAYLLECFKYDPLTGDIVWANRPIHHFKTEGAFKKFNNQYASKPAFTSLDGEGYKYAGITVKGKRNFYKAHRVIWKMVHGVDPDQIDHDNRDRTDNRLVNLVSSSNSLNSKNRGKRKDNTTGYTGVGLTPSGKFVARFPQEYLGTFNTAIEAHNFREQHKQAKGYHANHGI